MEIAEALQKVSAVSLQANISLDEMASMIAVVSSDLRTAPESIGQSFKTILLRMQNVKLGKFLDDEGQSISDVEKVLRSLGVELRDSDSRFRDMSDVLKDTMKVWNRLGEEGKTVEQIMIANAFAGQRQANVFIDLMSNQDKYNEGLKIQAENLNLVNDRYKIYLESVEASANKFKASWEGMWQSTINSDAIKFFYDLSASIFDVTTKFGGLIDLLQKGGGTPAGVLLLLIFGAARQKADELQNGNPNMSMRERLEFNAKKIKELKDSPFADHSEEIKDVSAEMVTLRNILREIDSTEVLGDFESRALALKNNIGDINDKLLIFDEIQSDVDFSKSLDLSNMFSGFDKVSEVVDNFRELNYVTIDQADSIKEMMEADIAAGNEFGNYQDVLRQEDGQIRLNVDALQKYMIAKVDAAIASLKTAEDVDKSTESFRLELQVLQNYKTQLSQGIPSALKTLKAAEDERRKAVEAQQKAYDELLRKTIDGLKKEKEAERDALQSQLDGYKKIIDASKELLDQKRKEEEYADTISEKNKTIADIENELLQIQFDNSEEANARRLELEDERAKAVKDLADTEADHSVETQKDALDKEYDAYKDFIDNQIKAIEAYLADVDSITAQAISMIGERIADYIDATTNAGVEGLKSLGNQAVATAALMSDVLRGGGGYYEPGEAFSWGSPDINRGNYDWTDYTGGYGRQGTTYRYHEGGIVGEKDSSKLPRLQETEVYAKLLKGEVVSTEGDIANFMRNTLPRLASNVGGTMGSINAPMVFNIAGDLDRSVLPEIEMMANRAIANALRSKGFVRPATSFAN